MDLSFHSRQQPILVFLLVFACWTATLNAQQSSEPQPVPAAESSATGAQSDQKDSQTASEKAKTTPQKKRRGVLVGIPIPISSPAVGSGVNVMAGYIFPFRKSDTVSPPSIVGVTWAGTDNGTRAWAAGTELYFNQDRYHVLSGIAHVDVNYYFYGTGTIAGDTGRKFKLNQTGNVFIGEASRKLFWEMFVGPRVWFATTALAPQHPGETFPDLPPFSVTFDMRSLGFVVERDTTPNRFYPEEGSKFEFGGDFFFKEIGSTFSFQTYRLTFNTYRSFDRKQVLAYNLYGCSTGGTAPFFGECIFGMGNELRGYPQDDTSTERCSPRRPSIASSFRGDSEWLPSGDWAKLRPPFQNSMPKIFFPPSVSDPGSV